MVPIAFTSSFIGVSSSIQSNHNSQFVSSHRLRCIQPILGQYRFVMAAPNQDHRHSTSSGKVTRQRSAIAIVGKNKTAEKEKANTAVAVDAKGGLFGMKANAYWESMGVLPLFFAGFGIVALGIKMLKVKSGEMRSGPSGINKVTIPKTAITSEEEEAELHVFKCGGCGYEMYPARGREFKFFPDSFKCPLCATPKSEFWDLNDPDDPRNQEDDTEEEDDQDTVVDDDDPGSNGTTLSNAQNPSEGSDGAESAAASNAEQDSSM